MKKLYNGKGKIHPSPPPSSPWDFLSALPAALLAVAAALSPEEKEVLVYLLSDAGDKPPGNKKSHQPAIGCGCFGCYKSFWARWNASPNNHLIHRILDEFEESLEPQLIPACGRRRRRRGGRRRDSGDENSPVDSIAAVKVDGDDEVRDVAGDGGDGRSSVRRFVSFIGERVWGVWN